MQPEEMRRLAAEICELLGKDVMSTLKRRDVKAVYVNPGSDVVRYSTGPGGHHELPSRLDPASVLRIIELAAAYAEEEYPPSNSMLWVELPRDSFAGAMLQGILPPVMEGPLLEIITPMRLAEIEEIQRRRDREFGVTLRRRPTATAPGVKQQKNWKIGEARTEDVLLGGFWVLRRGPDVDGADFMVQVPPDDTFEAMEPFQTFGRVQAKFFTGRSAVRIPREHVCDAQEVRHDYFLFLHSDDAEGTPVRYFFTAQEVVEALTPSVDGRFYVFRLGKDRSYDRFRDRSAKWIVNSIRRTLRRVHEHRLREMERAATAVFEIANTHFGRHFTYLFRRYEGALLVLYREHEQQRARILDARRDLYDSLGDFELGYRGAGPRLLAISLLAHHLERGPTTAEEERFLDFVECMGGDALDLTSAQIDAILGRPGTGDRARGGAPDGQTE